MALAADVGTSIHTRVDDLAWDDLRAQLDGTGHAVTPPLLTGAECDELAGLFDAGRFRSTVDMARHRFGDGRYRCFDHPLPDTIAALRGSFYGHLAPIANDWSRLLRGDGPAFPVTHEALLERCLDAGWIACGRSGPPTATIRSRSSSRAIGSSDPTDR